DAPGVGPRWPASARAPSSAPPVCQIRAAPSRFADGSGSTSPEETVAELPRELVDALPLVARPRASTPTAVQGGAIDREDKVIDRAPKVEGCELIEVDRQLGQQVP